MAERPSETPQFNNIGEVIQAFRSIIPQDIQERYLVGDAWAEFTTFSSLSPDSEIESPIMGRIVAKKYFAAYVVNLMSQALLDECAMEQKVDPKTKEMTPLSSEEIEINYATVKSIVQFVETDLGFVVAIDMEVGRPHVKI